MKNLILLAFVPAVLLNAVCAQNGTTHSTVTATITKTVYRTETVLVDLMTALPSIVPQEAVFNAGAGTGDDDDISVELKSIYVQTVGLTATVYSTEVDGVVVTSLRIITSTSTDVQEVTSTSAMHVCTTITTTSVVVPASTSTATTSTSHIPLAQDIAQMWGLNGGEDVKAGPWLVFNVVVLCAAHYIFFAHH